MPLSPEEIEARRFLVALRGYDKDQVDAFLRDIAADYRDVLNKVETAQPGQSGPDPFEALGEEVASVVRAAAERVTELERLAAQEAAEAREQASHELAAAESRHAESERQAQAMRSQVEREVAEIRTRGAEDVRGVPRRRALRRLPLPDR